MNKEQQIPPAGIKRKILKFDRRIDIIFKHTKRFLTPANYRWCLFCVFHMDYGIPIEKYPEERLTDLDILFKLNSSVFTENNIKKHMHKFIKTGMAPELLVEIVLKSITEHVTDGYSNKEVNQRIKDINLYFKKTKTLDDVKKFINRYLNTHKDDLDYETLWKAQKRQFLNYEKELKKLTENKDTIITGNNFYLKEWKGLLRKIKKDIDAETVVWIDLISRPRK